MLQVDTKHYASDALEDAMRLAQTKALNSYTFSDCISFLNYAWSDIYSRMAAIDDGYYGRNMRITSVFTELPLYVKNAIQVYTAQSPAGFDRRVYREAGTADLQSSGVYKISGTKLYCPDAVRRAIWLYYIPACPQIFFTHHNRDPVIYDNKVEEDEYGNVTITEGRDTVRNNKYNLLLLSGYYTIEDTSDITTVLEDGQSLSTDTDGNIIIVETTTSTTTDSTTTDSTTTDSTTTDSTTTDSTTTDSTTSSTTSSTTTTVKTFDSNINWIIKDSNYDIVKILTKDGNSIETYTEEGDTSTVVLSEGQSLGTDSNGNTIIVESTTSTDTVVETYYAALYNVTGATTTTVTTVVSDTATSTLLSTTTTTTSKTAVSGDTTQEEETTTTDSSAGTTTTVTTTIVVTLTVTTLNQLAKVTIDITAADRDDIMLVTNWIMTHRGTLVEKDVTREFLAMPLAPDDGTWTICYISCDYPYIFISYEHTITKEHVSGFFDAAKQFTQYNPFDFTGRNSNVEYAVCNWNDKTGLGVTIKDWNDLDENDLPRIKELGWTPDTRLDYPIPEMYRYLVARLADKLAALNESNIMGVQKELVEARYAFEAYLSRDKAAWQRIINVNPPTLGDWI